MSSISEQGWRRRLSTPTAGTYMVENVDMGLAGSVTGTIASSLLRFWCPRAEDLLYFDLRPSSKMLFQGDIPEGSDTFQWPVIGRDHVGGLRLMIWDKVKVPLCHYSDSPEENCMTVISAWWRLNIRFQRSSGWSCGCWII